MEFRRYDIKSKNRTEWFSLHFISDVHVGSSGHNERAFKERIEEIKADPLAYWMGVGDYGDHIYYNDPRFSLNDIDETITIGDIRQGIMGQVRRIADKLGPIKDKCIGVGTGNHEETITNRYHVDPTRELAFRMDVPYLGYSALIYLAAKGVKGARIFTHHGYGGGRKSGAQINKVEDAMRIAVADIYAIGHVHVKANSQLEILGIRENGKPERRQKIFVVTGSYQRAANSGTTSFAEKGMYPQAPMGSPTVQFRWIGGNHDLDMRVIS